MSLQYEALLILMLRLCCSPASFQLCSVGTAWQKMPHCCSIHSRIRTFNFTCMLCLCAASNREQMSSKRKLIKLWSSISALNLLSGNGNRKDRILTCLVKKSMSHQSKLGSDYSEIAPPRGKISIINKDERLHGGRLDILIPFHL